MGKSDKAKRLGGPNAAPLVEIGQLVDCELRGVPYEEFIPEGHYIIDSLDGSILQKKDV
jgi:hypothetical protein